MESYKNHTKVMGILNITPDSFYDGGRHNDMDAALFRAEEMVLEGVEILDIGGESTRPGARVVSAREEMERILPVVEAVAKRISLPVSVDTYKADVAREAIKAGASMINDIRGLRYDQGEMAKLIAETDTDYVLMHYGEETSSGGELPSRQSSLPREHENFGALLERMERELGESLRIAEEAGISKERIILDPGIGFGKTRKEDLYLLGHPGFLKKFGCRCLLGASRKRVVGYVLDLPAEERLEGSLATTALAVTAGYEYVRVHDVKEHARFIKMLEAALYSG